MIEKAFKYIQKNTVEGLSLGAVLIIFLFWQHSIDQPNTSASTDVQNWLSLFYSGLIFVLLGLIFLFYKFKSHGLELKRLENISLNENLAQNIRFAEKLKSINRLNDYVKNDINLPDITKDFFNGTVTMTDSTSGLLYLNQMQRADSGFLSLFKISADLKKMIRFNTISANQMIENFPDRIFSQKMAGSNLIFDSAFSDKDQFSDWIFVRLDPHNKDWAGLLFLSRNDQKKYTDLDFEIIESLVTQFTIHVENFRLSKKADEAQLLKSAFLSNMNHEIRTPLNAIIGYSEILEKSESDLEKRTASKSIKKNSAQLSTLIDNMLDVAKTEFNQITIQKTPHSIHNIIAKITDSSKIRCLEKGLDFSVQMDLDSVDCLLVDEDLISQILMNLIGNAIKFTDKGSVILKVIAEKKINSDLLLKFIIIDQGVGISAKSQLDLFQNFSQSDNSFTRKHGGLGLGLSLARRLANAMNGEVTLVKSETNGGSHFLFELPCQISDKIIPIHQNINATTEHKKTSIQPLLFKKILLVEDVVDNQDIFKYFLHTVGALVDVIDNGQDAIILAQQKKYDLILMDIQIPIVDGLEATRQILKNGYTGPIIALTAHSSIDDRMNCIKAGCADIITKPVTQLTLTTQIEKVLSNYNEKKLSRII